MDVPGLEARRDEGCCTLPPRRPHVLLGGFRPTRRRRGGKRTGDGDGEWRWHGVGGGAGGEARRGGGASSSVERAGERLGGAAAKEGNEGIWRLVVDGNIAYHLTHNTGKSQVPCMLRTNKTN
jgi:hypothetical protein